VIKPTIRRACLTNCLLMIEIDLVTYCEKENVPFTTFRDFGEILKTVKGIVGSEMTVEEVMANKV
jgi:2-hydroxy-3-keto-5-methylthiopentenyl-1-phosphate phosphatase